MLKKLFKEKNIFASFFRVTFLVLIVSFLICFSFLLVERTRENKSRQRAELPELRISFITDIHARSNKIDGVRSNRKIKDSYLDVMKNFYRIESEEFGPDAVINGGDVIEGTGRDSVVGTGELRSIRKFFENFPAPKFWVVGNHDLRAVNKQQWKESLEIDYLFKAFDLKGYRIIILDSNFVNVDEKVDVEPGRGFTQGKISQVQLKWLEVELQKNDQETLIFVHHPPLLVSQIRNRTRLLLNAQEFQDVVSKNGNVLAVFSGHIERLYHKVIEGIHYFVIPGTTKHPDYPGCFAEIEVEEKNLNVRIKYQNPQGEYISRDINQEID